MLAAETHRLTAVRPLCMWRRHADRRYDVETDLSYVNNRRPMRYDFMYVVRLSFKVIENYAHLTTY